MTEGKNLKLKRRATAKGSQESHRQRNQRRRTSESKAGRQPPIYQQLRSLREPQIIGGDPLVDGGFADNSGAATAVELLETLLGEAEAMGLREKLSPIGIIVGNDDPTPKDSCEAPAAEPVVSLPVFGLQKTELMTKGQNLKLKRRAAAKESQESHRQRHQRRRTRESKEERQPPNLSATSRFARPRVAPLTPPAP